MKDKIKAALIKLEPELKRVAKLIEEGENDGIYDREDPDAQYLRSMFNVISEDLSKTRRYIRQLSAPLVAEETIYKRPDGRYGSRTSYYTSGAAIEYLFTDSWGDQVWVYSHIEHNGEDYYIVNNPKLSLEGLRVRVKRLPMWD
ncbi:DUF5348 domain-containing protein [Paenibacillus borealis]|uniref:DUF5348 domain-containing protein n=1 Tax=Paenibacillus borealis TaxID=160799 RepID=A0A089MTC4_PAEBO|nr:DUF5348 domain-containing protein [Paenibacillus borealis]AIQ59709.1 hypothetical protein PBOR_24210 [Paenibacillus borealis]